jgi:DNA-binding Lrp family transcriptional regulator
MHNHKQPFNLRWKQIEPLYRQSSPRLKLTEIAARLNITPSQVSRVVRRATDNGLVERRRNATAQFRGMNFGTLRRALISIMLDAYYEEIEEAEQETSA